MSKRKWAMLVARLSVDIVAVSIAWWVAYFFRFHLGIDAPKGVPVFSDYLKLTPFIIFLWIFVASLIGFYHRSLRRRSAILEAIDIGQTSFFAILAFIVFSYFYDEYRFSRLTLVFLGMVQPILLVTFRSLLRKLRRTIIHSQPNRGVLVIGSGDVLVEALSIVSALDFDGLVLSGIIPVGDEAQCAAARTIAQEKDISVWDKPNSWEQFFIENKLHSVLFALPFASYRFLEDHIAEISVHATDIKVIPDVVRYARLGAGIDLVQGVPLVNIHESPLSGLGKYLKRLFDLLGSALLLILFAPSILLIAVLVKLSSKGPIFYFQERMGLDGKVFHCIKFRSMPVGVESKSGPIWAKPGEQRATKIGTFLRRFSLDELPQLLNVLRGEMSLVGPRPERPVFVQDFRKKVPGYMLRHKAKAGITGWAQVNGWRGNTSIEKRIEYDLFYIQNWSLWLDLKILVLTLAEVIMSKNAY